MNQGVDLALVRENELPLLGIDGGGTSLRSRMIAHPGAPASERCTLARPGNYLRLGRQGLADSLRELIAHFAIPAVAEVRVLAGFAGAGAGGAREEILAVFVELGFRADRVTVLTDAELGLQALGGEGMLLIAGTGSVCVGRFGELFARAGGWGFLFDHDPGSGYFLGHALLSRMVRLTEGLPVDPAPSAADDGALEEAVRSYFTLRLERPMREWSDIRPYLYENPIDKSRIAGLAVHVFEAAARGNAVAVKFIENAARALAALVAAVAMRAPVEEPLKLGLWGGLFFNDAADRLLIAPLVRDALLEPYRTRLDVDVLSRRDLHGRDALERAMRRHGASEIPSHQS